ncbi:MAG: hypothetical protein KBD90_05980, partial [Alphaproteobacteria bacterium]|nr:hypothetical protein [Alphaproteobacteria bacterium]
ENLILSQPKEEKKTPEVPNLPFTVLPEETMEKLNDHLEKKSDFQIEIENLTNKSQEQFAKDRKKKKKKKNVISKKIEKKEESIKINSITKKAEIRDTHHTFLEELCTTSVTNQNIRWTNVVSLFNSPAGFNGKVYGKNDGASNTFEVFLKFDTNGNLAKFLSEEEFNFLKEKAEPELKNNRKFLLKNGRLASYKLLANAGSIATSFFTLHNPHPSSFLYLDLLKRLKEQLELLGINHETVESKKEEK